MLTVARFSFPYEAQVARAKLESEGIPAFVADEHTINMQWLYSNAMGGVKVQVPNSCRDAALEVLAMDYSDALVREKGIDLPRCSLCDSENIEPQTKGKRMAFVAFLFFSFPLWPFTRRIKCNECGELSALQKS